MEAWRTRPEADQVPVWWVYVSESSVPDLRMS